jgi:hypothetical protein
MGKKQGIILNARRQRLRVVHGNLRRYGDSAFKSYCPACEDGILLMERDPGTGELLSMDRCLGCAQGFVYVDVVGGLLPPEERGHMENVIGDNAGKVWASLKEKGPQTVASLSREARLTASEVDKAIGWLAREDKLAAAGPDNKFSLRP